MAKDDLRKALKELHPLQVIDLPPSWTAVFAVAGFALGHGCVGGFGLGLGGLLILAGLGLMGLAAKKIREHDTTIIPHFQADELVTTGIYARTRNPIYLGDVLILSGIFVAGGAGLSLLLVPAFIWVLTVRFVLPEERRLAERFGDRWTEYAARTRRWI